MGETEGLAKLEAWRLAGPDRVYDVHSPVKGGPKGLVVLTDEYNHMPTEEGEEGSRGPDEMVAVALRKWNKKKTK